MYQPIYQPSSVSREPVAITHSPCIPNSPHHWTKVDFNYNEDQINPPVSLAETGPGGNSSGRFKKNPEAFSQGTMRRILKAFQVHSPAIIITVILIGINNQNIFWFDENPNPTGDIFPLGTVVGMQASTLLNLLQLAAKLHEIFIMISVGTIALNMYRRRMAVGGLPLGLATAGYRVGDLEYLISSSFRRGWPNAKWFATFILVATIYSTLAGPSSAILMLPTLGWFNLPDAFSNFTMPLYASDSPDIIWPERLNGSWYDRTEECKGQDSMYTYYCSAGWFPEVYNWAGSFKFVGLADSLTYQQPTTGISRRVEMDESLDNVTRLTTISGASIISIGRLLQHIEKHHVGTASDQRRLKLTTAQKHGATRNLQPVVQSKCALYDRTELRRGDVEALYDSNGIDCHGSRGCLEWQKSLHVLDEDVWNTTSPDKKYQMEITSSQDGSAVIFYGRFPYVRHETEQRSWVYSCNLFAHWAPAKLTVDEKQSSVLESNVSSLFESHREGGDKYEEFRLGIQPTDQVHFGEDWLEYVNPVFNVTEATQDGSGNSEPETLSETPLDVVMWQFMLISKDKKLAWLDLGQGINGLQNLESARNNATLLLQRIFGVVIVESLARLGNETTTFDVVTANHTSITLEETGIEAGSGIYSGIFSISEEADPATTNFTFTVGDISAKENITLDAMVAVLRAGASWSFDVHRWGYGFGQPNGTLHFGVAVMYLYMITVAVYAAWNLWHMVKRCIRKTPRSARPSIVAFGNIQKLLLLSYRSTMTGKLRDAHDDDLWTAQVQVRPDAAQRLRLVVGGSELSQGSGDVAMA